MAEQIPTAEIRSFLGNLFNQHYASAAIRYIEDLPETTEFTLAGRISDNATIEVRQRIGYKSVQYFICYQPSDDGFYRCVINDETTSTVRLGLQPMTKQDQAIIRWCLRDDLVEWSFSQAETLVDEIPDRFGPIERYQTPRSPAL